MTRHAGQQNVAEILLVLMFLYSGVNKIASGGAKEKKKLQKMGLTGDASQGLNFLAGIVEVVASLTVIAAAVNCPPAMHLRRTALTALLLFTILVTLLFKIWPRPTRMLGFTANLAVVGGLLLALNR